MPLDDVDDVDPAEEFLDEGLGDHGDPGKRGPAWAGCYSLVQVGSFATRSGSGLAAHLARRARTWAETWAMSARPASWGLRMAITLPMSAALAAPAAASA